MKMSRPRLRVAMALALGLAAAGAALAPPSAAAAQGGKAAAALLRTQAAALEHGEGVVKDAALAATLYCQAARLGDAEAQFNLGWMYANGRGVERSDATAAYFFRAAAAQGIAQADRMLAQVGAPPSATPACLSVAEAESRGNAAKLVVASVDATQWPVEFRSTAPPAIVDLVKKMAPEYQVHPQLALSIMKAESNFNPQAVSPKNAQGLMQLIPETAARFNVKNAFDPTQNIRGGLAYLRWLLAYFEGDLALVAAAYNAGEGTVERHLGVPPYSETRQYVKRILDGVGRGAHPFDAKVTKPSPQLAQIRAPRRP
ncbi:MAG: transglycosylase SLT domain-containing protein [Pseudomonadota bacterium]